MIVTAGATDVSVYFYIVGDASNASPGDPVTGLLFSDIETGGSASYMRQGAARTDFELVTQTAAGAHTDGGFVLVDDTNMPGVYRCDVPDAAFSTGVDQVVVQLVVASANDAAGAPLLIDITDVDLRDSVRAGMTSLPNAAAEAAGGLYTRGTGAGQVNQDANGRLDANTAAMPASIITSTVLAADAITNAKIAADAIGASELATDCIASDQLAATAVTDIWAQQCESEGTYTAQQILSICLSVLAGETNTGGTIFRTPNDGATRVTATVDASDNRTAMTLTPSS